MKAIITRLLNPLGMQVNQADGLLDFVIGFLLILLPWFYVREGNVVGLTTVMVIGSGLILYTIFTDYRKGIIKALLSKIHQILDITVGVTAMALLPLKLSIAGLILIGVILFALAGFHII